MAESLGLTAIARNRLGIAAGAGLDVAAALAQLFTEAPAKREAQTDGNPQTESEAPADSPPS